MLFDSIRIGNIKLRNRIVMPGFYLGYCPQGGVSQRLIDFYQARARGGAGLIMIGGTAIDESGLYGGWVSLHNEQVIPEHRRLVQTLKEEGTAVGMQLLHPGRYSFGFKSGLDVVAPSPIASRLTGHTPRELKSQEVEALISSFGQAARRAREAGYDLVEVVGSAGYLLNQFLSPLTNQRNDEYGGSVEKRQAFCLELIKQIRHQVGSDYVISVRLGGNDFMPGGNTWREMGDFARLLEGISANMINVTGGWHETPVPQLTAEVPRGAYAYLAAHIKSQVSIPVAASNRINDPGVAESILRSGQADLITVARGLLADPEWPAKASQARAATIRRCIACMTCLDSVLGREAPGSVACAINPEAGRETEARIEKAARKRRVLVVGAGPAGLESARVAALRGHQVELWEKEVQLGGQWQLAAIPPGKQEFLGLLDFYRNSLHELGVEVRFKQQAEADSILAAKPDLVIIASGARPQPPAWPANGLPLMQAWEVLAGRPVPGRRICVIGGGSTGSEAALYLAGIGTLDSDSLRFLMLHQAEDPQTLYRLLTRGSFEVSLVEIGPSLAVDMGKSMRWTLLKHLALMGVKTHTGTRVIEINRQGVKAVQGNEELMIPCDLAVMATGVRTNQDLYAQLQGKIERLYLVGDAHQPGRVMQAIHGAYQLASQL